MPTITVFDGASSIGGNKIYVEEGGRGVFLDFGKNFGKYGRFYEEYLKNRTTRGIHDLLHLGLIPKLNIYRQDLIPSDISITSFPKLNVTAVLLSHAHLDHCGNIGLLDAAIPIVATPMSVAILKGLQDTTKSATDSDVAYISERAPLEEDPLYLESKARSPYRGKDFLCTTEPPDSLLEFLCWRPGQDGRNAKKLEPGTCTPFECRDVPFEVSAHEVDHSIYGACGYILRGEGGVIAYTGDFRLHGKQEQKTRDFVRHAKDANLLIIEGTRVGGEGCGDGPRITEERVEETCRVAVEEAPGLAIADFSARNFERLESFTRIAERTGRRLVVTARDLYMLHAIGCVDGIARWEPVLVYDEIVNHASRKYEMEVVRKIAGDKYVAHTEIREHPERYLLCFSYFDMNHLLDIRPPGGIYLYSACEPFNEEMEIDFRRLMEWLGFFGIRPAGFTMVKDDEGNWLPRMDRMFHASGHAPGEDIACVIDRIDPDRILPVHTELKGWFTERWENVDVVEDGGMVRL